MPIIWHKTYVSTSCWVFRPANPAQDALLTVNIYLLSDSLSGAPIDILMQSSNVLRLSLLPFRMAWDHSTPLCLWISSSWNRTVIGLWGVICHHLALCLNLSGWLVLNTPKNVEADIMQFTLEPKTHPDNCYFPITFIEKDQTKEKAFWLSSILFLKSNLFRAKKNCITREYIIVSLAAKGWRTEGHKR